MMSWNYRVMKRKIKGADYEEEFYAIYEVYYEDDGSIKAWTEKPVSIQGETLEELKNDLGYYSKALKEPVLDYNELEKKFEEKD